MSSLSAPRWSTEDETRETLSLSERDREKVCIDVFGLDRRGGGGGGAFIVPTAAGDARSCGCTCHVSPLSSPDLSITWRKSIQEPVSQSSSDNDGVSQDDGCRSCSANETLSTAVETEASDRTHHVMEAIEGMSDKAKGAYCEARTVNGKVTAEETRFHLFLQRENGDARLAAARVCAYWNFRRRIFKERAYLPLKMAGLAGGDETALDSDDLQLLRSGALQLLPPDDGGRRVLFFDKEAHKNAKQFPRECLTRCMFYLMHAAINNDSPAAMDMNGERREMSRAGTDIVLLCNFKVCAIYP
jgi:hypothetical protein